MTLPPVQIGEVFGLELIRWPSVRAGTITLTIVLVKTGETAVVARAGHGTAAWVASHGATLSFQEATGLYPLMNAKLAQRGWRYSAG